MGWAFYLACSWTWCIGMFLPVLLIRDYGVWGWAIFTLPNVIGASAMAYILKKSTTSAEITEKHKIACIVFSIVTMMFQIYFIGWISTIVPNVLMLIAGIVLFLVYVLGSKVSIDETFSAFLIWVLSLVCFIVILNIVPIEKIDLFKAGNLIYNTKALLYLTPVCFFGFLLCPYLDLTFHKARQSNTFLNSKIAFTIGFCFLFLLMVLFTFFYARPMASVFEGVPYMLKDRSPLPLLYVYVVVFHMLIQAGFTILLHFRSVLPMIKRQKGTGLLLLISGIVFYLMPIMFNGNYTFLNLSTNEIIYRSFMAFYALVAPTYVFLFMIPKNNKNISLDKNNLFRWVKVVLLALPFYAIAFLGVKWNLEICLLIGLTIVLDSRVLIGCKKESP